MTDEEKTVPVGVLCGKDIERMANERGLIEPYNESCLQACSYDLRIGTIFREGQVINEKHSRADEQVVIEPGEVVSVLTQEILKLPNDITGTAFAINSQSREGLMVLNPGHVDPGFSGQLSVKAINLRKVALPISRGDKIFTVIFEKLPKMTEGYKGSMPERMQRE